MSVDTEKSAGRLSVGPGGAFTETKNEPKPTLSCVSVAKHVTCVTPAGNVLPEAGEHVGVRLPLTASTAVTVNDTTTYKNGVKVVPSYLLKPVVVDKTNWEKILIDGGYYKKQQIN